MLFGWCMVLNVDSSIIERDSLWVVVAILLSLGEKPKKRGHCLVWPRGLVIIKKGKNKLLVTPRLIINPIYIQHKSTPFHHSSFFTPQSSNSIDGKYCCWYTTNILNISVFNAFSIGGGPVAAVLLCIKRDDILIKH